MNNSFVRLVDGMCATLRAEVLTRLTDEFARGQVYGVINLLNTFKVRADWSAGFLLEQIAVQEAALDEVRALAAAVLPPLPEAVRAAAAPAPAAADIGTLLARRDANNSAIETLLAWLDAAAASLGDRAVADIEAALRRAMRAEVDIELKNSPRPLFAAMSSGREG